MTILNTRLQSDIFMAQTAMEILGNIRSSTGHAHTSGLSDEVIDSFLAEDSTLFEAIEEAAERFIRMLGEYRNELMMDELELVKH